MRERRFRIEFSPDALKEAARAAEPSMSGPVRDVSGWLCPRSTMTTPGSRSSRVRRRESGGIRLFVAIAQVDPFVPKGSALDAAAQQNTTSIYTGVETFPMLPERLSTDLSSLAEAQKRLAVITEMLVDEEGKVLESTLYPAVIQNQAQLTYDAVAFWLEKSGQTTPSSDITRRMLDKVRASPALQEQLSLQDQAAQALCKRRHQAGALTLQAIEFRPILSTDGQMRLGKHEVNRATQLIEDLMIAANQASVRFYFP